MLENYGEVMQTFLPHSNILETAKELDSKRLNKQILESYQILKVLSGASPTGGWRNHPAVLMWKKHERALHTYAKTMIAEANFRGIKTDKNAENIAILEDMYGDRWGTSLPSWMNDNDTLMRITTTHKVSLFNKDPMYYMKYQYAVNSAYNTPCCPERKEPCKYYWPTHVS
jgi:hypothetical protein